MARPLLAFLFLILSSWSLRGLAQQKSPVLVGIYSQHAAIINHSPKMSRLANSYPQGVELNVQVQTTGKESWHQAYHYPRVGISVIWLDYGNPVIGQSLAVSPYVNKSFYRTPKKELNFRMGTGLAYFTNKFNMVSNPENNIISSSLNAVLQARVEYEQRLGDHYSFLMGFGLNHYSNGATCKPNLGVNLPTVSLGFNYHSQARFTPVLVAFDEPFWPGIFLDVSSSVGVKHLTPVNPTRYWVNSLSVAAGRHLSRKSNLLVGVEGFYDRSLHKVLEDEAAAGLAQELPDIKRVGLVGGHELVLGNLSFLTQLGVYVYRPFKYHKFYYQRLGLKYHFTHALFGEVDLKVHGGQADVIEWRLGMRLHRQKPLHPPTWLVHRKGKQPEAKL